MNIKHVKSLCCGAKIRRFGGRRRQCCGCKKTWTIRPQKRGRPRHRTPPSLIKKVFLRNFTLTQLFSSRSKVRLPAYRSRFRLALKRFLAKPHTFKVPTGPLVLLADGVWFQFGGKHWVLYLSALKSSNGKYACFLEPFLYQGKEGAYKWHKVFTAIPRRARQRICAVVVDNLRGMQLIAKRNNWLLQLCHFHMLFKLQVRRKGIRHKLIGGSIREELYRLISYAMHATDPHKLNMALNRLECLSTNKRCTKRIRATVREFVECVGYYRTFLDYPNLGLPTTTNTMESMGGLLRSMLRRSRAGSNPKSLLLWATALIRMKEKVICNGHKINR